MKKIKIKGMPKGSKLSPLYQQDKSTYALDTSYRSMSDEKKDEGNYRDQFPEADPEEASLEAETGERILTPELENFSIGGKKHSQGGTLLDPDPGSFIFSNDKSLRIKGDILNEFGINPDAKSSKKGLTPAEIAKKYSTNKFLNKLRDKNSDDLDRDTASLNLEGMKKKLSKLAFLQESMKSFPDGVPDFVDETFSETPQMKKGGLVKAQMGIWSRYSILDQPPQIQGSKPRRPRFGPPGETDAQRRKRLADWHYDPNTVAWGRTQNKVPGRWHHGVTVESDPPPGQGDVGIGGPPKKLADFNFRNPTPTFAPGPIQTGQSDSGLHLDGSGDANLKTYQDPIYDTGYGDIDYLNMAAPYAVPLSKYYPRKVNVNPQSLNFNPLDLEAQRQGIKGQAQTAMGANNTLSDTSSLASVRNSQILGQTLDPLNQSYMTEFNANQAGRTQTEAGNAQFRQQADVFNAEQDARYDQETALTNENYDNEKRLRLQQFMKGLNSAERNRQIRNAGNVVNQDYMITANGNVVRKPSSYDPDRQYQRITGMQAGSSGLSFDDFVSSLPDNVRNAATPQWLWEQYKSQNSATYSGKDAGGVGVRTKNPYLLPSSQDYVTPY